MNSQPQVPVRPGRTHARHFNRNTDPRAIDYRGIKVGVQPLANSQWKSASVQFSSGRIKAGKQVVDQYLAENPSLGNWLSTVTAMEEGKVPSNILATYRTKANKLAKSTITKNPHDPMGWIAVSKFSLEDGRRAEFDDYTSRFIERFPEHQLANYYYGVRSIQNEDWETAERSLRKAKALGMSDEGINQLLKMVIDKQRWVWQFAQVIGAILAAWLVGLGLLYAAGSVMSAVVMRSIKNLRTHESTLSPTLRFIYRALINVAGLYYYVSLPVLVILAVALPLSLGYALLHLPSVSLILIVVVLALGCGGVLTAISGIRTCFIRLPREFPGKRITAQEAPRLWELVEEVASQVGTRPVDEIRVTAGAELFVAELGGYFERMKDRGQRVLAIGMRFLDDLDENAFRSVLAHEYGHFLHRDTAGGDVAMRILRSMDAFVLAILQKGPVRFWDVSVHFLRFYHRLFRRLTFGASRLQEIRADDIAVKNYGARSFQRGLTHAIRSSLEFELEANEMLRSMIRGDSRVPNFYSPTARVKVQHRAQIEALVEEVINAPTTEEDTHPSPSERCQLALRHGAKDYPADGMSIAAMIPHRAELMAELNTEMAQSLRTESIEVRRAARDAVHHLRKYLHQNADPMGYLERAAIYHQLGEFDKALDDLKKVPANSPPGLEAAIGRATIFESQGEYQKQIDAIEGMLKTYPQAENTEFDLWLGKAYAELMKPDQAAICFDRACEQDPKSVWALVGRARAFAAQGMVGDAIEDYESALEVCSHCPEARRELSQLINQTKGALA